MEWAKVEHALPTKDGLYHVSLVKSPLYCEQAYWKNGAWLIPDDLIEKYGEVIEWRAIYGWIYNE